MTILIQSNFLNSPVNIDEILRYNEDGFEKTHLTLNITARDEEGASSNEQEEVPLFGIKNLVKNGQNNFTWEFFNYSKINIDMQVEIIDEKRDVVNRGKMIRKGFTPETIILNDILPFKEYKDNQYYYRIRLFCMDEGWDKYYPTRKGVLFTVEKDYKELKEITVNGDFRFIHKFLMDKLTDETTIDPNYVRRLIDLICNPVNNRTFKLSSGMKGRYALTSKFDAYGEVADFGTHDNKYQFTLKDINHFISDKHTLNTYVDGKKIFTRDNHTQIKGDGISRSYIQESNLKETSTIELESFRDHLIDSETFMCNYLIQTNEDVENLYTTGITIPTNNIGEFLNSRDLSVYVRFKNSNSWKRINPYRTKIDINYRNDKRFSVTVRIKDNYVPKIGNEIMVVSNNILNAMYYRTDTFNRLAQYYQVPCYFVPVTHVTDNGEVITEFMEDIENVEVYVNGYRLIPNVDFALINVNLHAQIPTMILFKDMTHWGSKIEVIYHDHRKNTYHFFRELLPRADKRAVITLKPDAPPLIEGTFTIFANNKKLHNAQYDIINSRSLILKNVTSKKNIMVKFHHDDDELLTRLLELYKKYPPKEDFDAKIIGQTAYIEEWIKNNTTMAIEETDKDPYVGLKYVYQLNDKYNYFEQMYDMIKNGIAPDLDANNSNLFTDLKEMPVIMDFMKKLPLYFNHDISVNCNRAFNEDRFEDNVALFNPGRSYLIMTTVDRYFDKLLDADLNCNVDDSVEFLTYLNENIPLILPYLNNNILIDCNEAQSKDNYKGLK
jgi:hypothetical protein